jgi:hypothetical protein
MTEFLQSYFGKQAEANRGAIIFPSFNLGRASQQTNVSPFKLSQLDNHIRRDIGLNQATVISN